MKKLFYLLNYLSIITSLVYYSLIVRVSLLFGCQYASMFSDPKNMGFGLHYTLAIPYALGLNLFILLPLCFILLIILVLRKELHRDTIILSLINIICFYFIEMSEIGPITWLAD